MVVLPNAPVFFPEQQQHQQQQEQSQPLPAVTASAGWVHNATPIVQAFAASPHPAPVAHDSRFAPSPAPTLQTFQQQQLEQHYQQHQQQQQYQYQYQYQQQQHQQQQLYRIGLAASHPLVASAPMPTASIHTAGPFLGWNGLFPVPTSADPTPTTAYAASATDAATQWGMMPPPPPPLSASSPPAAAAAEYGANPLAFSGFSLWPHYLQMPVPGGAAIPQFVQYHHETQQYPMQMQVQAQLMQQMQKQHPLTPSSSCSPVSLPAMSAAPSPVTTATAPAAAAASPTPRRRQGADTRSRRGGSSSRSAAATAAAATAAAASGSTSTSPKVVDSISRAERRRTASAQSSRRARQRTTAYINELEEACIALQRECEQIRGEIAAIASPAAGTDDGGAPQDSELQHDELVRAWRRG